jgi:hypothetical protein
LTPDAAVAKYGIAPVGRSDPLKREQLPHPEMIAMDDIRQQLIDLSLKLDAVVERL